MILEGNSRGYGANLAEHLMNPRDNDHVTVHAVDGFMTDYLLGAFAEVEAISGATQCSKYLFSLSLNPPEGEVVSTDTFEAAIADVEKKLGLSGQPRAVVFHEKNGRRHAHCVWSRIDAQTMKAIELPHYKLKLGDISRELYRRHDWEMPAGFRDKAERDPLNYSRQEAQQAKRTKRDPKKLKAMFQHCWEQSDSIASFQAALKEQGYLLARGDQRGFVAVDADGKIWSLSRWCGVDPKELRARLGSEEGLPSVDEVLAQAHDLPPPKTETPDPASLDTVSLDPVFAFNRTELIARQRKERADLLKFQEQRRIVEVKARRAKLPKGLGALFSKMTGRYQSLVKDFDAEAKAASTRDRKEQQELVDRHLEERRELIREARAKGLTEAFRSAVSKDPRQGLELPQDDLQFTKKALLRDPALILGHISKTKAAFERTDILRELAKKIGDPLELSRLADQALRSSQVVKLDDRKTPRFTTRDYRQAKELLETCALQMKASKGFGVADRHIGDAIQRQNKDMYRAFGGRLSEEQAGALKHILSDQQMACVVGLAGAGKSTLLKTAMDAWSKQGITVHGAALAGKAADGLEDASDIQSRTLASLEASWENGNEPIKRGDVLVIDEAGMIDTRQLSRIANKLNDIGAKLVLVGDPEQLQPIEAGRPFKGLVKTLDAAKLTEIHRQREDWQRQSSRSLADGNIGEAMEAYTKHNCVHRNQTGDDAIEALVEAYAMDVAANGNDTTRLAFAHSRKNVHALNQAIRATLRDTDNNNPDILLQTDIGKRAFGEGDRIVFSRNDRGLGVKNGMLGTVRSVSQSKMIVTIDGDPSRKLAFNPKHYQAFDHGYAVTIHKSQGATVDQSYVLASRSMDNHLAYVAMTRHRDQMQLYINNKDQPYWSRQDRQQETRSINRDQRKRSGPSMG